MTTTPSDKPSPSSSLQRGKACLRCRKRKMRCDGIKPACANCLRAKSGHGCEYDDGKGKTRTQLLREKIEQLEGRIKELEDPDNTLPMVALYDPHGRQMSESSSSGYGSPEGSSFSLSHSPFRESGQSPEGSWANLPGLVRTSSPFADILVEDPSSSHSQPSLELSQMLLDIFAPHRSRCGLEINMRQLSDSLRSPLSEQRHPALLNSIYLWACFVSRPEPLCQHEEYYLSNALDSLRDALSQGDRVLDIIQASCLLSTYFFSNGRVQEGCYHAGAAASFAVQHRLHQGIVFDSPVDEFFPTSSDAYSWERITTFWQVFNLDRCWSVVTQRPPSIPDGPDAWTSINCPWPQEESHYDTAQLELEVSFQTIRAFLNGDVNPSGYSPQAVRAKASALFQRAHQIAASWDPRTTSSERFNDEIRVMDMTILNFLSSLVPVQQLDTTDPESRQLLLAAHTLAHSATLHLYRRFYKDDDISYDKCLQASRAIVAICKMVTSQDIEYLDPVIGHCWSIAAESLICELKRMGTSWSMMNNPHDVRNEIGTLLYVLNGLSTKIPVMGISAAKVQAALSEL